MSVVGELGTGGVVVDFRFAGSNSRAGRRAYDWRCGGLARQFLYVRAERLQQHRWHHHSGSRRTSFTSTPAVLLTTRLLVVVPPPRWLQVEIKKYISGLDRKLEARRLEVKARQNKAQQRLSKLQEELSLKAQVRADTSLVLLAR